MIVKCDYCHHEWQEWQVIKNCDWCGGPGTQIGTDYIEKDLTSARERGRLSSHKEENMLDPVINAFQRQRAILLVLKKRFSNLTADEAVSLSADILLAITKVDAVQEAGN